MSAFLCLWYSGMGVAAFSDIGYLPQDTFVEAFALRVKKPSPLVEISEHVDHMDAKHPYAVIA